LYRKLEQYQWLGLRYLLREQDGDDDLLTGRTVGLLKLYSLFPDAEHFIHREQTLCLDVTNAIG
jgi:hypothetical protein